MSLLSELSDPLFFLSVLRGAYDRFMMQYSSTIAKGGHVSNGLNGAKSSTDEDRIRASGELFALTGFGLCILKLPNEVVHIEGSRLAPVVMDVSIPHLPPSVT